MEKLIKILTNLHGDIDFYSHKTLIDDGVLDSFDLITIIADISDKFDVDIPVEEILPENFNSAKALYALIERLADE